MSKRTKSGRAKPETPAREILPALGEVFRAHGYEGTSLALITQATGLGKGSLYNLFPGGKEEMAAKVLAEIDGWFERNVFAVLRDNADAQQGIARMFDEVETYFRSGNRVCLVGVFALGGERDIFGKALRAYFKAWEEALASALRRSGQSRSAAMHRAEEIVWGIQGALVLARAKQDPGVFSRAIKRLRPDAVGNGR